MAVTRLDAVASGEDVNGESYSISAGDNRLLVVAFQQEYKNSDPRGLVTCTYGGVAMTEQVAIDNATGTNDNEVYLFTLDEAGIQAASGTAIVFSGKNSTSNTWFAASYEGVDQTTPIPEVNSDENDPISDNPLLGSDIEAGDNSAVVAVAGTGNNVSADWSGGDLTEQSEEQGNSTAGTYADDFFGSGQTVNVWCEWDSPNRTVICAMEIAAATGIVLLPTGIASLEAFGAAQVILQTYKLEGITKNKAGDVLVSCKCHLFKDNLDNTLTYIGYVLSDAVTGAYSFTGIVNEDAQYLVIAWKDDTPHVFDSSDHVLQPVEE